MGDKTSWGYLPQEIRLPILEAVMEDGSSLASLATVSREWQTTMERHNFARIRLTPSRIPDFDSMTRRNRALVRYLWVCLELEKYDRPYFDSQGVVMRGDRTPTDNVVVTTALHDLLWALSTWEPQGDLLLDISLYSPSDSEYWFKELTFVPDFPSSEECDRALSGTAKARRARIDDDEEHGWTRGAPPGIAIAAAFHPLLSRPRGDFHALGWGSSEATRGQYDWWKRLPRAPAVTGLLLRQQTRRRLSPLSVAPMLRCLPRVREVHYEPWRHWSHRGQLAIDSVYKHLFAYRGFSRLERLVLFENSDERFYLPSLPQVRAARPAVSRSVARASLRLKHLSGAFVVDAGDVFRSAAAEPAWAWPNLATLALTSRLLAPGACQGSVDGMLVAAAAAAGRMPALETMEIWNGREGLAGLFRYRSARGGRTAGITWRGTWDLVLEKDVIQAWEDVANMYRRGGLVVVKEKVMDAAKIRFHGDAIYHLGLEAQVVRPVSLYQMRMERDIREGM